MIDGDRAPETDVAVVEPPREEWWKEERAMDVPTVEATSVAAGSEPGFWLRGNDRRDGGRNAPGLAESGDAVMAEEEDGAGVCQDGDEMKGDIQRDGGRACGVACILP